jgi:hypothetical protein
MYKDLQSSQNVHESLSIMCVGVFCTSKNGMPHMEQKDTEMVTVGGSDTSVILEHSIFVWIIHMTPETYVMSPAVEGDPYSSNKRIKSPNCP